MLDSRGAVLRLAIRQEDRRPDQIESEAPSVRVRVA